MCRGQNLWFTFQVTVTMRFIRKTITRKSSLIPSWRSSRVLGRPSVSSSTTTCTTAIVRMATKCTGVVTTTQGRDGFEKSQTPEDLLCLTFQKEEGRAMPGSVLRLERKDRLAQWRQSQPSTAYGKDPKVVQERKTKQNRFPSRHFQIKLEFFVTTEPVFDFLLETR